MFSFLYDIRRPFTSGCLGCQFTLDRLLSCVMPVLPCRRVLAYTSNLIASIKIRYVVQ